MSTQQTDLITTPDTDLARAGQTADHHAARAVLPDYLSRRADNTIRQHAAALEKFGDYLRELSDQVNTHDPAARLQLGRGFHAFAASLRGWLDSDQRAQPDLAAFTGLSFGLVSGFRAWLVAEGYAVATINLYLGAVRTYAKLAGQAGLIPPDTLTRIKDVSGYGATEGKRVNERRDVTRCGNKKAEHTRIGDDQADQLKRQPDTPQGRRDAVIMTLLLDHGLRVGELVGLTADNFDLDAGTMAFYREKTDTTDTHDLTAATLAALRAYMTHDAPDTGPLLRRARKGGKLGAAGVSVRSARYIVRQLGASLGIDNLSPHDCRHYWATYWAKRVDILRLQEAGGWASLTMPRRYVERAKIANQGMT